MLRIGETVRVWHGVPIGYVLFHETSMKRYEK